MTCLNRCPQVLSHDCLLMSDDCLVYREINSADDQVILQRDLSALVNWAKTWGMRFNLSKCTILRNSHSRSPFVHNYEMCGEALLEECEAKYLGVIISNALINTEQPCGLRYKKKPAIL